MWEWKSEKVVLMKKGRTWKKARRDKSDGIQGNCLRQRLMSGGGNVDKLALELPGRHGEMNVSSSCDMDCE